MRVAELSMLDIGAYVHITDGKFARHGVIVEVDHSGVTAKTRVKLAVKSYIDQKNIGQSAEAFKRASKKHILNAIADPPWRHPNSKYWGLEAEVIDYLPPKW